MKRRILSIVLSAALICSSMANNISFTKAASVNINKEEIDKITASRWQSIGQKDTKNEQDYVKGDAIVVYKKTSTINSLKKANKYIKNVYENIKIVGSYEFSENLSDKSTLKKASKDTETGFYIQNIHSNTLSTQELIKQVSKDDNVLYAEPNYKVYAENLTNDTYSKYQWSLENKAQNAGTAGNDIKPQSIWKNTTNKKDAVIAVIDTGVDYTHEDLKDIMWQNPYKSSQLSGKYGYDFFNGTDDPLDDNGHGSHCAGVIAASANNNAGISGISQGNTKIMALKFLSDEGYGDTFGAVGAYYYLLKAKKLGTNVVAVNNSWGSASISRSFKNVLQLADAEGIISVMAAGNETTNLDTYDTYPASFYNKNNVVVGASTEKDDIASFSNYGAESVDIAAPGTNILSTVSYNCLNPSIYSDEQKEKLLKTYYDGESFSTTSASAISASSITVKVQNLKDIKNLDEILDVDDDPNAKDVTDTVKKISSDEYFGVEGKSTMFDFTNAKAGERYTVTIPYKTGISNTDIYGSMMLRLGGNDGYNKPVEEDNSDVYDSMITVTHFLEKYNAGQNTAYYDSESETELFMDSMSQNKNTWNHIFSVLIPQNETKSSAIGGKITIIVDINNDNKCCFYLDDLAISKENAKASDFGKYDFYSGTSMAAPTVTGAIAALYNNGDNANTILSKLYSCIRKSDKWKNKSRTGGILDLSKVNGYEPIIQRTDIAENSNIVLTGFNFGKAKGMITFDGKKLANNKIISWSDKSIVINASEYIYKTVEIGITNSKNNSTSSIYCLKNTAKKLEKVCDLNIDFLGATPAITTDGTDIYMLQDGLISKFEKETGEFTPLTMLYIDIFNDYLDDYEKNMCSMECLSALYYINNCLWTTVRLVGSYHEITALVRYNIKNDKITVIQASEELADIDSGTTMALYNNKIYFIGGYKLEADNDNYNLTYKNTTIYYDINSRKWKKAASMPVKSAIGTTAVNNNKLYYIPGLTDNKKDIKLYCYNGSAWSVVSKDFTPFVSLSYGQPNAMGVCKNKLIFISNGSEGYGTVMTYNLRTNKLEATGYDTGISKNSSLCGTVTMGNMCYFMFLDMADMVTTSDYLTNMYRLYCMPVTGVPIKVTKVIVRSSTKANTVQYGNKLQMRASVVPSNAKNKAVKWTVNNSSYASISSKGILTPKEAGVGKTVTIKAVAKDGSKAYGRLRVKITKSTKSKH